MNQGCPHEGVDHRLLGKIGCWVQSRLSYHTDAPPKIVGNDYVSLRWPPYVGFAIPIGKKYFTFRTGFRWDPNWATADGKVKGGYIFPEAIIKVHDTPLV